MPWWPYSRKSRRNIAAQYSVHGSQHAPSRLDGGIIGVWIHVGIGIEPAAAARRGGAYGRKQSWLMYAEKVVVGRVPRRDLGHSPAKAIGIEFAQDSAKALRPFWVPMKLMCQVFLVGDKSHGGHRAASLAHVASVK